MEPNFIIPDKKTPPVPTKIRLGQLRVTYGAAYGLKIGIVTKRCYILQKTTLFPDQTTTKLRPNYDQTTTKLRHNTTKLRLNYDQTTTKLRPNYELITTLQQQYNDHTTTLQRPNNTNSNAAFPLRNNHFLSTHFIPLAFNLTHPSPS